MRALLLLVLCLPALAPAQSHVDRSEIAALQQKGYRFYAGRWRLPMEIAYLQRAEAKRTAPPAPVVEPAKAHAKVPPRAAPESRQPRRSSGTGLFTIRLQNVSLLGFDTVPVSFGAGQARLHLPRTQSISIGTTVALPLR